MTTQVNSPALSGYLVLWRHGMDDVPVGLFRTKKAAIDAAHKMSFRAGYAAANTLDIDTDGHTCGQRSAAGRTTYCKCRTPLCFAVVSFDNGKPTEMLVVDREDDAT